MEVPNSRNEIVRALYERVCECAGSSLVESEALAVSVALTAVRDREELVGMLLNSVLAKRVLENADKAAVKDAEWEAVFGKGMFVHRDGGVSDVALSEDFKKTSSLLQSALRCSLVEKQVKEAWDRPVSRAGCYVALHSQNAEDRVAMCLGGMVRADSRRLDDVRSTIEDEGADHLLLCKVAIALGSAVAVSAN